MSKGVFEIAAQYGGRDVFKVVSPLFRELKSVLKRHHGNAYADSIRHFSFVLRADGNIQQFDFEGPECLNVCMDEKVISIDIGLPVARWQGSSSVEILDFLSKSLMLGLQQMITQLKDDGIELDDITLERDMVAAIAAWREHFS